ncbi:hypothetical protein BC332_03588 [Capsicum chinense]|nr:hypothetical protein BC332_03588 [Capsicum chinense]
MSFVDLEIDFVDLETNFVWLRMNFVDLEMDFVGLRMDLVDLDMEFLGLRMDFVDLDMEFLGLRMSFMDGMVKSGVRWRVIGSELGGRLLGQSWVFIIGSVVIIDTGYSDVRKCCSDSDASGLGVFLPGNVGKSPGGISPLEVVIAMNHQY